MERHNKYRYLALVDNKIIWCYIDHINDNLSEAYGQWENRRAYSPLLQWTGQKDRKGREIYEGHKVAYSHATDPKYPLVYEGEVKYDMENSKFICDAEPHRDFSWRNIEITGDKYEKK